MNISFLRKIPIKVILVSIPIGLAILCALFSPLLSPQDPLQTDLGKRLTPPVFQKGGSLKHFLGTDHIGRELIRERSVWAKPTHNRLQVSLNPRESQAIKIIITGFFPEFE